MQNQYDVVIVGGGAIGLASARAAARRGSSVLLLEQFAFGHARGSSHGSVRAFAFAHPDPALVDDSVAALALWRELEAERGAQLTHRTGSGLRFADLAPVAERLEANGLAYDILSPEQANERYGIRFEPGNDVIFTQEGGTIFAERALMAYRDSAQAHGAELRGDSPVTAIEPDDDGVTVTCADGSRHRGGVVLVAAGPWAARLLEPLGIALDIKTTLQTIAYYDYEPGTKLLPCVYEDGEPPVYWVSAPGEGLKIAEALQKGPGIDPDDKRPPRDEDVARITDYVASHFTGVATTPSRAETCLMTDASDNEFHLERVGKVVYAAACGGRGFKFSLLTGERLANLALPTEAVA
ncbi:MAG TPA: FAD-dependent oxidoreductase [Conexibacter sp.]|jgi:sarcosine oxidase